MYRCGQIYLHKKIKKQFSLKQLETDKHNIRKTVKKLKKLKSDLL